MAVRANQGRQVMTILHVVGGAGGLRLLCGGKRRAADHRKAGNKQSAHDALIQAGEPADHPRVRDALSWINSASSSSLRSLVAQRLDRIEPGGLARRIIPEEYPDGGGEQESAGDRRGAKSEPASL